MADEPHQDRLRQLEERLSKVRANPKEASKGADTAGWSQGEVAWRMVIEMVSGLLIGMAIGYGLDWLFGTLPVLMVIFTVLGLIAGVKTMLGTASELNRKNEAGKSAGDEGN